MKTGQQGLLVEQVSVMRTGKEGDCPEVFVLSLEDSKALSELSGRKVQRASGLLAVNLKLLDIQADGEAGGVSGQECVRWECGQSECGRSECGWECVCA